jgi:hypothetical protein
MNPIDYLHTGALILRVSREELEALAMDAVCACWYYDLADTLEETPDADLVRIIEREPCIACE